MTNILIVVSFLDDPIVPLVRQTRQNRDRTYRHRTPTRNSPQPHDSGTVLDRCFRCAVLTRPIDCTHGVVLCERCVRDVGPSYY